MKYREDIALMSPFGCVGVELGIATGQLTERFATLDHFSEFHGVDRWSDRSHTSVEYRACLARLEQYENVHVHKMDVIEWLNGEEDESLGFIYIDCYAHNGQEGGSILEAAWPKLAEGGIFSGDDYDENQWAATFRAVNEFAESVDRTVRVYDKHLQKLIVGGVKSSWDVYKSWYFRK